MASETRINYWLMKAEPDSRIEKGVDVKFSIDDFQKVGTTPWEGVRNNEAKNHMLAMKSGDKVLFYHSNCKNPGVAGFAEVCKEAYPDHTAWDPTHPYFDERTKEEKPRWHMVDLQFNRRAKHFVPLWLLKQIASAPLSDPPDDLEYIGASGVDAIKEMTLLTRGRLSVHKVDAVVYAVIESMADQGGWDDSEEGKKQRKRAMNAPKPAPEDLAEGVEDEEGGEGATEGGKGKKGKVKAKTLVKGKAKAVTTTTPKKATSKRKRVDADGDEEMEEILDEDGEENEEYGDDEAMPSQQSKAPAKKRGKPSGKEDDDQPTKAKAAEPSSKRRRITTTTNEPPTAGRRSSRPKK